MTRTLSIMLVAAGFTCAAHAAPDDQEVLTMEGSVADTCSLGTPSVSASSNANLASSVVTFSALADETTAVFTGGGSTIQLSFDGMCNYAHDVSIQSTNGWLINADNTQIAPGSGNFNETVGYTPTVQWHTELASFNATAGTAGQKTSKSIPGAFAGTVGLQINLVGVSDPSAPMLAGTYTDDLVLQLGAAL